jgi:hypothetical protein
MPILLYSVSHRDSLHFEPLSFRFKNGQKTGCKMPIINWS